MRSSVEQTHAEYSETTIKKNNFEERLHANFLKDVSLEAIGCDFGIKRLNDEDFLWLILSFWASRLVGVNFSLNIIPNNETSNDGKSHDLVVQLILQVREIT